jgi:hypothetical protein
MKTKLLLFSLLLVTAAVAVPVLANSQKEEAALSVGSDSFFDDLEEQAVKVNSFATVTHKPPHPLMVWMRIIGSPIVSAYFTTSQKVQASWKWLIDTINDD